MGRARLTILASLLAALFVGCESQQAKQGLSRENSHLRWVVRLYVRASQQGHAPKNEAELKQFFQQLDVDTRDKTLAAAGVNSLDELFVSERDGLPYAILYGPVVPGVASGLIAFEQKGDNGLRYVGYTMGMVEEVDEPRFDTLVPKAARNPK